MSGSGHHTRINTGVLAAAEKRTLIWIAQRLPRWVNSDHLTLLALVSMAAAGAAFWASRFWLPALGIVSWSRDRASHLGGADDGGSLSRGAAAAGPGAAIVRGAVVAVAAALAVSTPLPIAEASAAGPRPETIDAWDAYVAATETRIASELAATGPFLAGDLRDDGGVTRDAIARGAIPVGTLSTVDRSGRALPVPGGTIAHWRGAVLLPGMSLDTLLHLLQHPDERGPYPEDVLSLRVLNRGPDRLTLAMRLTRTKIVTATYDTEHVATYRRLAPTRASSRSVSTKVLEVADAGTSGERVLAEGRDRGFLWRMNSYWRYEEVPGGVVVELESITLSRGIPMGLGMVLAPMIDRIARESVTRTLASVRRLYSGTGPVRADCSP
jgi:hypothetical protein